jgi:predicted heme/steroid binding protein
MKKPLMIIIALVVVAGIGVVGYKLITKKDLSSFVGTDNSSSQTSSDKVITSEELAENNGKNGASCWVAVNGKVYDMTGVDGWEDGEHKASDGQTTCGQDETDSIGESPHGAGVLSNYPVIGAFSN